MKKLTFLILMIVSCCLAIAQNGRMVLQTRQSAAQQVCTRDAFTGFSASFSFSELESVPVSTEKGVFSAISVPNTYLSGDFGQPSLPAARQLIAVPVNATPVVEVKSYSTTEYLLSDYDIHTLMPQQPSVRKDQRPEEMPFHYNAAAYQANRFSERTIAQVEVLGTMRGVQLGTLTIYPFSYNPATNVLRVYNDIEVEVKFEGGDYNQTQDLYQSTYSPYFAPVYSQLFNRNVYDDHPDLWQAPVHMLVIANRMFESALEPWLEWKTQKGFYVDVNYTDEIGSNYNAIRSFIVNKYNEGMANNAVPTFLAIIGDVAQVPNTNGNLSQKVTDLNYASVDGDTYPDMYSFRMSAETVKQLSDMINKALVYEKYTMSDPSYLSNVLLIAGADSNWNPKVGVPTLEYGLNYYFNTDHGYSNIYSYTGPYTGCYNHLNTGVGFVNYTAHGGETSWSDPSFTTSNVNSLTNNDKYFWAIGNCCLTGNFGYSQPCLGEAFTRAENKGAFAYIGSCPVTYWYEDFYWSVGAHPYQASHYPSYENSSAGSFDGMFMDDFYNTVNSTMFIGNLAVTLAHDNNYQSSISAPYYWQSYHTFGDGSIMPYRTEPEANEISHMEIVPIGVDFYTVEAVPGSYVAVSKDGVLHGAALVSESGSVDVPIEPILAGGEVMIVVTHPRRRPSIEILQAAALEGPYLVVNNTTPTIIGAGQTANIDIAFKNVGTDATTTASTVTFTCDNPLLTLVDATTTFDAIAADEIITINNAFTIEAAAAIENGDRFTVVATIENGSETWSSNISFTVGKPVFEFDGYSWDGSFEPGESYDILVRFTNKGLYQATNTNMVMTTENDHVTINNAFFNVGTIDPDGTAYGFFNITIAENAPSTEVIELEVGITADLNISAMGEIVLANSCNVVFDLMDSYGDGWNGCKLRVSFSDGTPQVEYTIANGSSATYTKTINTGTEVTLTWVNGSYASECSFTVSYEDGDLIYASNGTPTAGVITTFVCECAGAPSACEPITNLNATVEESTVTLTWMGDATSYLVLRNGGQIATITDLTYTDTDLTEGTYNYCVIAVCGDGVASPVCETAVIEGLPEVCMPASEVSAQHVPEGVSVDWAAAENAVTYTIYRDGEMVGTAEETTFIDAFEPEIGATYCYTIQANCAFGDAEMSEEFCLNIININEVNIQCNIFPNPVRNTLYVESENPVNSLTIFNMVGQVVYTAQNCGIRTNISVAHLTSGLYMIQLNTKEGTTTRKFVVE